MIDFGYGISPSSAINLERFDRARFDRLCAEEPDVLKCMACGSCAASCPTAGHGNMNLRKVILILGRGCDSDALAMTRSCMLCGKCLLVCPRGINTRHLILSINKIYK